ncbi:MAG: hypothetical protein CFE23_15290 [Flavobacterium sp. BFFFF1]|uniref:hypothetical protein n=1 Tax=unclassified Flavobacterium TaxID=196869 RepID=UPI000BD95D4A|nr:MULTISPECIES: hypothetical protein [unclassified Flavobacterium]OYU79160.1 MAG: hypothetical protein CFE23_15290 [Flavobacterium sp. BFFFF1]
MKNLSKYIAVAVCSTLLSCGGGGGGGETSGENPSAALLVSPINNSECITGQEVSATQSKVTFEWNNADFTDAYSVYVKNLNTQQTLQYEAGASTTLDVTLAKNTPYSWWIISKSSASSQTAISEKRKFYNAGDGVVNYAPFPAEAVAPAMSSTVSGTAVTFQWNGSDVDNDITEYKLYMDTNSNPTSLKGTTSGGETLNDIPVSANTVYYWKVVTKDGVGNTSDSPIFQFKTL